MAAGNREGGRDLSDATKQQGVTVIFGAQDGGVVGIA
jgi:hypothetical protein